MSDVVKVGDFEVRIRRKKILHMHLYVEPPDGHVIVSAPQEATDESVVLFVRDNLGWVLRKRAGFANQNRQGPRQYISGETHYLWGEQLFLQVVKAKAWGGLHISGNELTLIAPEVSTVKSREEYVRDWYRRLLAAEVQTRSKRWEEATGFHATRYEIRYLTRLWGSCSPKTGKVTLNLQLAKKAKEGLDYVILHELCHFRDRTHGKEFLALLDRFMPNWRDVRRRLNAAPLDFTVEDGMQEDANS